MKEEQKPTQTTIVTRFKDYMKHTFPTVVDGSEQWTYTYRIWICGSYDMVCALGSGAQEVNSAYNEGMALVRSDIESLGIAMMPT